MRHFVVYHNPLYWDGRELDPNNAFGIGTNKRVERTKGQRIWLITRTMKPLSYWLASSFIVESTGHDGRFRLKNWACGRGQKLGEAYRVDQKPWWKPLLGLTGSFAWGLTEIRDRRIIRGLESMARNAPPVPSPKRRGGGFGSAATNRKIERAAVGAVERHLLKKGWMTQSVESENRGFDLIVTKPGRRMHVEVKGTSGTEPSFILTPNERNAAKGDNLFRLAVVTEAGTRPRIHLMTYQTVLSKYSIEPVGYRAVLK